MASKDPGAFAHNAKYIIELLYDSITDVNTALVGQGRHEQGDAHRLRPLRRRERRRPATGTRTSRSTRPARPATAARTASASTSSTASARSSRRPPTASSAAPATTSPGPTSRRSSTVPSVTFPSGVVRKEPGNDNVCETCHRGREAKATVDAADRGRASRRFKNVHYLPAGRGQARLGRPRRLRVRRQDLRRRRCRTSGGTQCTSCHDPVGSHHTFQITDAWDGTCRACHADAERRPEEHPPHPHRSTTTATATPPSRWPPRSTAWRRATLAAMQAAAAAPGLCYAPGVYPYFFKDTERRQDLQRRPRRWPPTPSPAWTPALVKAAFNYQLSRNDPGAWAHNFDYMAELLYDSAADWGTLVRRYVRACRESGNGRENKSRGRHWPDGLSGASSRRTTTTSAGRAPPPSCRTASPTRSRRPAWRPSIGSCGKARASRYSASSIARWL